MSDTKTRLIGAVFAVCSIGSANGASSAPNNGSPISAAAAKAVADLSTNGYGKVKLSDQCYVMTRFSAMKPANRSLANYYAPLSAEFLLACAQLSGIEAYAGRTKCEAEFIPTTDTLAMQKVFHCEPVPGH